MLRLRLLAATAVAALSITALAQAPYLVKDLNTTRGGTGSSFPRSFCSTGGKTFFNAQTLEHGIELWVSDANGTRLVKDIRPGSSSAPYGITALSEGVVLLAANGTGGTELWRSDGTAAGTYIVKDIAPGDSNSAPSDFFAANGRVFFVAWSEALGHQLYVTDGTSGGTVNLIAGRPAIHASFDGFVFFTIGNMLYKTDGTVGGTTLVKSNFSVQSAAAAGSVLLVSAYLDYGNELFKTDGTDAGTVLVKHIDQGYGSGVNGKLVSIGDKVIFVGYNGTYGNEPWVSDGTEAGTMLLQDISGGFSSTLTDGIVAVGSSGYFLRDGALWRTDGTPGGTVIVAYVSGIKWLAGGSDRVYFAATDSQHGVELWSSEGTIATTMRLTDAWPGTSAGLLNNVLTFTGGKLYFEGVSPQHGGEPWVATPGGAASLLANVAPDPGPSANIASMTAVGELAFFVASGDTTNVRRDLYRSDGTIEGTVRLTNDTQRTIDPNDVNVIAFGQRLVFANGDQSLWQSDGTAAGTGYLSILSDFPPSFADRLYPTPSLLYFERYLELWRTDGTRAGTTFLSSSGPPESPNVLEFGGRSFYLSGGYGASLWETGGTPETTRRVTTIPSYHEGYGPLVAAGGTMFFITYTNSNGLELWRSDGTLEGTKTLKDIAPGFASSTPQHLTAAGAYLYFTADDGLSGVELWRTDGTADGTVLVKDIAPGANSSSPSSLRAVGSTLFFVADDGLHGSELWKSDGTPEGTVLVRDIVSGPDPSTPLTLLAADGLLWFSANDGTTGTELWKSDGTDAGTVRVGDINPGASSAAPSKMIRAGRRLFFSATGPEGTELWALALGGSGISIADAGVNESAGSVQFVLRREGDVTEAASVQYATVDGSAKAGSDYVAASGTLDFAPGQTTRTLNVALVNDSVTESSEAFRIVLSNAAGASVTVSEATATIGDDDKNADLLVEFIPYGFGFYVTDTRTIKVTNNGPSTATDVKVRFNATPFYQGAYATTNSANPAEYLYLSCSGNFPMTCTIPTIRVGQSWTLSYSKNGPRGFAGSTPPGETVSASATAAEPDATPADNKVEVMVSSDGLLTTLAALETNQASNLLFRNNSTTSQPYQITLESSNPAVTLDATSFTIPAGGTSATTVLRTGASPGWTTLTLRNPYSSTPTIMQLPIVAPGTVPQLDSALILNYSGTMTYQGSMPLAVGVAARRFDDVFPTGTISLLSPEGNVVATASAPATAAGTASFTISGLDPGQYTYSTRYEGDALFRGVTVQGPSVSVYKIYPAVTLSAPSVVCGMVDVLVTVRASHAQDAPPGSVTVSVSGGPVATVPLSPTGVPGESRAIARLSLRPGSHYVSAQYLESKYYSGTYGTTNITVPELCTPDAVSATATAPAQVVLAWRGAGVQYEIMRGLTPGALAVAGTTSSTTFIDNGVQPGKTYFYRVRSFDSSGVPSDYSAMDLATTVMMADNPVVKSVTPIRAVHILELRTAVNAVRAAAGLAPMPFEALAAGSGIRAIDITSLRTAIAEARNLLGMPLPAFTDPSLAGQPMKAVHIEELRNGVR